VAADNIKTNFNHGIFMSAFTTEERLALLLNVLGDDAASVAFQAMNPTRAKYIRQLLDDLRIDPPSSEEIEYVIGDFHQYFRFAMQALGADLPEGSSEGSAAGKNSEQDADQKKVVYFSKITPSDNPIDDLNRLDPYQVATALDGDHPKTVAMVLRHLDTRHAAKAMEFLSADVRSELIVFLSQESTVPFPIVNQVLKSTVEKANTVDCREEEIDQASVLAELMRSLPKDMRVELMAKLQQSDEELTQNVKSKLYLFQDVLRLDDRDVQKILGEVETDGLIVALQRADQELCDKLLNNLSKRARESIMEEMQYKEGVSDEEIAEARTQLVAALARLDENGEIKLK
jgi:flagellar motor switch protein FliG